MGKSFEWKPWYRRKGYSGNLTEDQKRKLDSFRTGGSHPATSFFELPQEVQDRIYELELQIEGHKETEFVWSMGAAAVVSVSSCYLAYSSVHAPSSLGYLVAAIVCLYVAFREWRKYQAFRQTFFYRGDIKKGEPSCFSEEGIQRCWELNQVLRTNLQTNTSDIPKM